MRLLVTILVALCLSSLPVRAAPPDNEGYEPVNGDMMQPGESIPANRLVAAAYGFLFAAVAVYAGSVAMRARKVEDEVESLRRRLEEKR